MEKEGKMVSRGILIFCVVFFVGNINANIPRILNGHAANIEDFPYQASIRRENIHICGGSIISERHVLTAGHCVYNEFPPYFWLRVITGTSYRFEGGTVHEIADIIVHPEYFTDDNRAMNDVAVITLKDIIVFNEWQQKISLPTHKFTAGQRVNLTGWGRVQQMPPIRPQQLQKLETELISLEECQQLMIDPEQTKLDRRDTCTIVIKNTGMCLGDSGGPLAVNGELVGIVSWTDGDYCAGGHPDVYVNVYTFKNFIEMVMKETEIS
ncbi:chymotrypsin-1-like [Phymastichus coffea]|uniref:chymotrypsin-1-like n=1 Tax=Phymastichus coffea TaxID=108790 RepID=UPI00273C2838|nr:chymotrypsin-1-like [Phymastichus coffea]